MILFIVFVTSRNSGIFSDLGCSRQFRSNRNEAREWFYLLFFGRYFLILGLFAAVGPLNVKQSMKKNPSAWHLSSRL